MIVYVDTSAAAKLLVEEPESDRVAARLNELPDPPTSSLLLETELRRMAQRNGVPQEEVTSLLERFVLLEVDRAAFRDAGVLPGTGLRSLDALHVAVALRCGADVMISYDDRRIAAAEAAGLRAERV